MNAINKMLKNIRKHIPYFLLIAIYFFFVNLEAKKDKNKYLNSDNEEIVSDDRSVFNDKSVRITIPVIPYDQ